MTNGEESQRFFCGFDLNMFDRRADNALRQPVRSGTPVLRRRLHSLQ